MGCIIHKLLIDGNFFIGTYNIPRSLIHNFRDCFRDNIFGYDRGSWWLSLENFLK